MFNYARGVRHSVELVKATGVNSSLWARVDATQSSLVGILPDRSFDSVHKEFLAELYIVFRLPLRREIKSYAKFVDGKTSYFMKATIG